ncbi:hypothetical protein DXT88_08455 [Herbaspirillum lusitanum]|nr:hypothetical protein [Herbaspirillum lusitanum]
MVPPTAKANEEHVLMRPKTARRWKRVVVDMAKILLEKLAAETGYAIRWYIEFFREFERVLLVIY